MPTEEDLANRFKYHSPNAHKVSLHESVRENCFGVAVWLNDVLPEGREKALAITKLEEVTFWANASLARSK